VLWAHTWEATWWGWGPNRAEWTPLGAVATLQACEQEQARHTKLNDALAKVVATSPVCGVEMPPRHPRPAWAEGKVTMMEARMNCHMPGCTKPVFSTYIYSAPTKPSPFCAQKLVLQVPLCEEHAKNRPDTVTLEDSA